MRAVIGKKKMIIKFFEWFVYIIYIVYLCAKIRRIMETTIRTTTKRTALHRKVIDIKPDTFKGLSVIAASRGTNLKNFIERSLDEIVESYDDAAIYRYLQQTDPEGMEMLSDEEQAAFEKKYGL